MDARLTSRTLELRRVVVTGMGTLNPLLVRDKSHFSVLHAPLAIRNIVGINKSCKISLVRR